MTMQIDAFKNPLEEEWKQIDSFDNYLISNFGRIKTKARFIKRGRGGLCPCKEKCLILHKKGQYYSVNLWKGGLPYHFSIHKLVASHFISNPLSKPQVNHKDGNKENNYVGNLEWCTASENMQHAIISGLKKCPSGDSAYYRKLNSNQVAEIRQMISEGYTQQVIADKFSIQRSNVSLIKSRKIWN